MATIFLTRGAFFFQTVSFAIAHQQQPFPLEFRLLQKGFRKSTVHLNAFHICLACELGSQGAVLFLGMKNASLYAFSN